MNKELKNLLIEKYKEKKARKVDLEKLVEILLEENTILINQKKEVLNIISNFKR